MGLRLSFFMRLRHYPFLFKTVQKAFDHLPMVMSVTLHLLVVFLLTYNFVTIEKSEAISVPVFVVDLTKVKVAEMTNLPPKLTDSGKKETPKKSVRTSAYSKASAASLAGSKPQPATRGGKSAATAAPSKASSGAMLENELNALLKNVTTPKKKAETPVPAVNSVKNTSKAGNPTEDPFKTLLASVDGIKGGMGYAQETPDLNKDEIVTEGIEGGQGGSYMQELSVSEKDLIGIKLRGCWNIDPGVRGAQNMVIEIRVFLNQDGTVKDVKILNTARYGKDTAFRSVAESARRAVYICDKKNEESPFKIFPKNYEESYDTWKTLLLRFNPLDGGVM